MKNVTLAIDEEVLAKVRRIASDKDTTVNALVREFLTRLADQDDQAKTARARLIALAKKSKAEAGPITWKRDELHDR
jgi:hypothetical protein